MSADREASETGDPEPPVVLKLGGSLITKKDRPETLDDDALDAACDAIAAAVSSGAIDRLALVHGGGSYGHHHASEHGVSTTEGTRDAGAVMDIHDGVATAGAGVTVVSGDELVVKLAVGLDARRVGVCSTVPGVLDGAEGGEVIPVIDSFDAVADALGASDATDVSGGMAAKVRELLALDAPASVFGPDGLEPFLRGGDPGTRIE